MKTRVINVKNGSPYDVLIDRTTPWGNPWSHNPRSNADFMARSRFDAILNYEDWLKGTRFRDVFPERRQWILDNLESLRGKILGCHCCPRSCHGESLVRLLGDEDEGIFAILT